MTISITNAWYKGKVRWYPHAIKLLHHTEKYSISNQAINMHSGGPTEQYVCVLEPHRGHLHKAKKVRWYPLMKRGQQSHKNENCTGTPMLTNCSKKCAISNKAINMHSRGPTEQHFYVWEPHCGYLISILEDRSL